MDCGFDLGPEDISVYGENLKEFASECVHTSYVIKDRTGYWSVWLANIGRESGITLMTRMRPIMSEMGLP